jgi:hypothetical protein
MSENRTPRSQGEIVFDKITRSDQMNYLVELGLPELIETTADDLNWLINDTPELTSDKFPNGEENQRGKLHSLKLPDEVRDWAQELRMDITVVPYGAGSSFLGFIQKVHRDYSMDKMNYDPMEIVNSRKLNLWDDDYGMAFRRENRAGGDDAGILAIKMARAEDLVKQAIHGFVTWNTVWKEFTDIVKWLYSIRDNLYDDKNGTVWCEIVVHDFPFTLDWLIPNLTVKQFIDCDYQTFVWCYLLSQIKHDRPAFVGHANNHDDPEYQQRFRSARFEVNRFWYVYQVCKHYYPVQNVTSYDKLFYDQDPQTVAEFLFSSQPYYPLPTSDEMKVLMPLISQYTSANYKLLSAKVLKHWHNPFWIFENL